MTITRSYSSSAYAESVKLLHELHLMMKAGEDESVGGRDIREEMEAPWFAMNDEEQDRIRGMSADLYTLEPDSSIQHVDRRNVLDPQLGTLLRQRQATSDWDGVLQLLRDHRDQISWDRAAPIRGDAYANLGDHATAALFFAEAIRLNSDDHRIALQWSNSLELSGKADEAEAIRSELLRKGDLLAPDVAIALGFSRLDRVLDHNPTDAKNLALLLHGARLRLDSFPAQQMSFLLASFVGEALCHYSIGAEDDALLVLDQGVAIADGPDIRTLRGLMLYSRNRETALADFAKAVEYVASDVWPYYFLAAEAMQTGDYEQCNKLCVAGIRFCSERDREVLAQMYEWIAISQIHCGHSEIDAKELLLRAAKLSPYSSVIENGSDNVDGPHSVVFTESSAALLRQPNREMLLRTAARFTVAA